MFPIVHAPIDPVAHRAVDRGADALDRGDASLQRDPGVLRGEERRLVRRLTSGDRRVLIVEVPVQVDWTWVSIQPGETVRLRRS